MKSLAALNRIKIGNVVRPNNGKLDTYLEHSIAHEASNDTADAERHVCLVIGLNFGHQLVPQSEHDDSVTAFTCPPGSEEGVHTSRIIAVKLL